VREMRRSCLSISGRRDKRRNNFGDFVERFNQLPATAAEDEEIWIRG